MIVNEGYTRAVDWWATGVVLYEMLCGRLPFSSKCADSDSQDYKVLFEKIIRDEVRIPCELSLEAKSILGQLLEKNAAKRLGSSSLDFEEIKRHCFFSTIDWLELKEKRLEPPFKPSVTSDADTCYFEKEFTGENVQLTPPKEKELAFAAANNNYFDSFSFYGSIASLNSQKSETSAHSSNKFDIYSLQEADTTREMSSSLFKRTRLVSDHSMDDKPCFSSIRHKKCNENTNFLASSAFPNIIQFTDNSGRLRQSQTIFANPAASSSSSASSTVSIDIATKTENIFMKAFYQNILNNDEKMEL